MNKSFAFLILTLMLVSYVSAADIAYLVKSTSKINSNFISAINELGYSYDVIGDSAITSTDFANYKMILIGDETFANYNHIPVGTKKSLILNTYYVDDFKIAKYVSSTVSNSYAYGNIAVNNSITDGISSPVQFYNAKNIPIYYPGYPRAPGFVSVVNSGNPSDSVVGYIEKGGALYGGTTTSERLVFVGMTSANSWTDASKQLFKNSIQWILRDYCSDADGDYIIKENSDVSVCENVCGLNHDESCIGNNDCNDTSADKWQLLQGYADNDEDGLGIGNLIDVCSGDSLPIKYSDINGDCNDNDTDLWQLLKGYADSDKDGLGIGNLIDICSGTELPSGYSADNNNDCNDTSADKWQLLQGYTDNDEDGLGIGNLMDVCSGDSLPIKYSDVNGDCNDTNDEYYQLLQGYIDNDNDGFGVEDLMDVCSGDSLAEGYSTVVGDCNDNNSDINPDLSEIPYNELDDSCQGYDLADVDGDGYCKAGYLIQDSSLQCPNEKGLIGTDCNDDEASINPDSTDLAKNCINDAPHINTIGKKVVFEGDSILINAHGTDPENNDLTYSINDSRFVQDDNVFSWQTTEGDKGTYFFKIEVSDGSLSDSIVVEISVRKTNQAPICTDIPGIEWNEAGNATINLNDYCSDEENDIIYYVYNDSSTGDSISLDSLDNGVAVFSSPDNWYGNGWIVFEVTDGRNSTLTNPIELNINHVNKMPVIRAHIPDLSMDENSNLTNAIDLNNYFSDKDNNLSFSFNENEFISIVIKDGIVSFYPVADWIGTETVIFNATDGEYEISSNEINVNVLRMNKAPVFEDNECDASLLEDESYSCQLNANDPENDTLSYSIADKNNLNCTIEGNNLIYKSYKDYFGPASCLLKVTDSNGKSSDQLFEVNIENVNDQVYVTDYSPKIDPKLLTGSSQMFTIELADLDSAVRINWTVNGEDVGYGTSYLFNASTNGVYNVTATATDGEYGTFVGWDVFVGSLNEFKCSEVEGDICSESQICSESFLTVSDSSRCCPVSCSQMPLQFNSIKNISQNKSEDIRLRLINPYDSQTIKIGETLNTRLEINNDLNSRARFEAEIYLYDITKDKVVEKEKKSVTIEQDRSKVVEVNFDISQDMDESNDYAVVARVIGKDNDDNEYYNQNYSLIKLERKSEYVVIKDLTLNPQEGAICGDTVYANVNVENLGTTDEDVTIKIENPQLNIDQSYSADLEMYDENNKINKEFRINIPTSAKPGNYSVTARILFANGKAETMQKILTIGECETENTEISSVETIKLESETKPAEAKITNNKMFVLILMSVLTLILLVSVIIALIVYNRNKTININKNKDKNMDAKKAEEKYNPANPEAVHEKVKARNFKKAKAKAKK